MNIEYNDNNKFKRRRRRCDIICVKSWTSSGCGGSAERVLSLENVSARESVHSAHEYEVILCKKGAFLFSFFLFSFVWTRTSVVVSLSLCLILLLRVCRRRMCRVPTRIFILVLYYYYTLYHATVVAGYDCGHGIVAVVAVIIACSGDSRGVLNGWVGAKCWPWTYPHPAAVTTTVAAAALACCVDIGGQCRRRPDVALSLTCSRQFKFIVPTVLSRRAFKSLLVVVIFVLTAAVYCDFFSNATLCFYSFILLIPSSILNCVW